MDDNEYPIPSNLNECFEVLEDILSKSEEDKNWFKTSAEDDVLGSLHHSLGTWIRNNWGLWKQDTELYNTLKRMGLWHADDMSGVIITSYHRKINGKELNIKEQIQHYTDYWKEYEKTNGPVEKD